ncbi:MAG: hydrogenase nickel incorporation protein HypB [Lachnospiraceae bacterium]|nr:hydrogenase nickel incorporation protein HypB [Lachnospiraceae bacterium]
MSEVIVMKELLGENSRIAEENREIYKADKVLMVNIMGAPGAGKTTLLKAVCGELKSRGVNSAVIEGDLYSSIDADAFNEKGIKSSQINTCGECHLDAAVIKSGYDMLGFKDGVVFIENVGNLICPAEFDLGENLKIVCASVPEGDDKPYKYVPMFSYVDAVVLTKCDLKEAVGFDTDNFKKGMDAVNDALIFETALGRSASSAGDPGVKALVDYILKNRN